MPVDTLQLYIRVVLLEGEVEGFAEVDVRTLNRVQVLTGHLELVEVEVFREHFHFNY